MTDPRFPGAMPPADDAGEAQLDALLQGARTTYNVPRTLPPLDAMWERIEDEAFGPAEQASGADVLPLRRRGGRTSRISRALRNHGAWMGLAAGLLIGVLAGRESVTPQAEPGAVAASTDTAATSREPVDIETARYLGQTAALLVSLPAEPRGNVIDDAFAARAQQLLATTRVLLDAASDAETRALLEDLELILAQIVGIRAGDRAEELELINEALEQRELLPRLHSAVNGSPAASAD